MGNFVYEKSTSGGETSSSFPRDEGVGKEYAYSRGPGIEYSSIKTMSAQK
jgi:hypothetical protein